MPTGFRDLLAYALRYGAQTWGYLLFLTDRYPDADPSKPPASQPTPSKPVGLRVEDDLRRSRLTVFFRLLLTIPHFVWLALWGDRGLLRADRRLVRHADHRPASRGAAPLHRRVRPLRDPRVRLPYPRRQPFPWVYRDAGELPRRRRDRTAGAAEPLEDPVPAFPGHSGAHARLGRSRCRSSSSRSSAGSSGLVLGRMPAGLRNLGAYVLRYQAQTYAYSVPAHGQLSVQRAQ